jgi:NADH:ubiquinone oxidoreductase subunit 5 (subunit L)/multisubunit Na+/H+ antiporter MnhA subunit
MRFMGQSMSLAVMGAVAALSMPPEVFSTFFSWSSIPEATTAEIFVQGIGRMFLVSGIISGLGVFTSLVRGKEHTWDPPKRFVKPDRINRQNDSS